MPKLRKKKRYTRVDQGLYRDPVYYLSAVEHAELVDPDLEPDEPDIDALLNDEDDETPAPAVVEVTPLKKIPLPYAKQREWGVPPTGDTRSAVRRLVAEQRRRRRLIGTYDLLPEKEGLVLLDWLHVSVDGRIYHDGADQMGDFDSWDVVELYRDASAYSRGARRKEGEAKIRQGGSLQFHLEGGIDPRPMQKEAKVDVPDWVRRMREIPE